MRSVLFLILLLVLLQGCISPQVKTGDISRYELPGLNNTTIFYLNVSSTQVIENINDRITFDYQITDNIATFKNPVAVDNSRNNASVNVSIITIMGRNYAHFNFSSNFSGFVAYSVPGGQDFTHTSRQLTGQYVLSCLLISQQVPCSWDISSQNRIILRKTGQEEKLSSGITLPVKRSG
jgi:hypothetical protein